jgi:hypothetical protein
MKGKTELLTNFNFFPISTVEMLHKEIQSLRKFFFLKIVKLEPTNKVQSVFLEMDAFNARKTSLVISFTKLLEWNEPKLLL